MLFEYSTIITNNDLTRYICKQCIIYDIPIIKNSTPIEMCERITTHSSHDIIILATYLTLLSDYVCDLENLSFVFLNLLKQFHFQVRLIVEY